MKLFRIFDNCTKKYVGPTDGIFYLNPDGYLSVTEFSFLPKELREYQKDKEEGRYSIEFSSGKLDIDKNEIFENDVIEMYGSLYKVTYDRVMCAWMPVFVASANDKKEKPDEFPKYNYNKPDIWSKVAKIVGTVRGDN